MSINQLDKILKDSLREKGLVDDGKKVLLFVYDRYYIFKDFDNDYPSANFLGVGWLNGWDWHMQSTGIRPLHGFDHYTQLTIHQGKPNIRPIYDQEAGLVREKLGERGTFGYIYTISPSDVELFRRSYRGKRIKLTAKVDIGSKVWTPEHQVEVVTFWDPYDTTSNTKVVWNFKASEENMKWTMGISTLQAIHCPNWYIQKVFDYIRGMDPVPTTVGGIYVKPEERRANELCWVGKSPLEEMLQRKPQEDVSKSNTIGSSTSNLRVLNGVKGKDSRVTKAPNTKTINRPQPVGFPTFKPAKAEAQKGKETTGSIGTN
jgi:hypothetical protein